MRGDDDVCLRYGSQTDIAGSKWGLLRSTQQLDILSSRYSHRRFSVPNATTAVPILRDPRNLRCASYMYKRIYLKIKNLHHSPEGISIYLPIHHDHTTIMFKAPQTPHSFPLAASLII